MGFLGRYYRTYALDFWGFGESGRKRETYAVQDFVSLVNQFMDQLGIVNAPLVGHSMGPWFHQQEPVLRRKSDVVIEEGMILAVEPQRQHWHIQDLVHVRREGPPEVLSNKFLIDEPFVIG